jgi:hypothetical protein
MEVGLAITVGTVLVAAAVFAYQQAKEAAGDSNAKQRVADLQALIETSYTQTNSFPPLATLREQWKAAREDHAKSPWGGQVITTEPITSGLDGSSCLGNSNQVDCNGIDATVSVNAQDPVQTVNVDSLQYFRIARPGVQPLLCCSTLYDIPRATAVSVYGYAVAYNKHGRSFYFVTSGRTAR